MDKVRTQSTTRPIRRIALIGATTLGLVAAGVTLAHIDFNTARINRSKITIDTVRAGTLEIKVSANGQLQPKNVEYLAAQVQGRVARKYVKPGATVHAGEPILDLTNPQLLTRAEEARSAWEGAVTELKAAEGDLNSALLNQEVALTQAQFDLEKAQLQLEAESKLMGQHVVAEIDFKRTQLNVQQLTRRHELEDHRLQTMRGNLQVQLAVKRSRVTELERVLERARNEAANLRISAGIDGIVQAIAADVGQTLEPGSAIGRIAQRDSLYAELKVAAREAAGVKPGQSVLIDTHSGTVDGVVTRVDPAVTDGTVIVDADLKGALPDSSRPQLPIEGVIYLSRLPNTLYVGKPSYVRSNGDISVYKLDSDGRYAMRMTVRAGESSLNYIQVLGGLKAGDRIITSETAEWQDKSRILLNSD